MISQALSVALTHGMLNTMGVVPFLGISISVKDPVIHQVFPRNLDETSLSTLTVPP